MNDTRACPRQKLRTMNVGRSESLVVGSIPNLTKDKLVEEFQKHCHKEYTVLSSNAKEIL